MSKYRVTLQETAEYEITVTADNEEEACEKAAYLLTRPEGNPIHTTVLDRYIEAKKVR